MASPFLPAGIPAIDSTVGGILPGQLTLLAGDAGAGKTWLALSFACAALARDEPVHFVTASSPGELCAQASRFLGRELVAHLRRGRLTVQTLRPGATLRSAELASLLAARGLRHVVLDPIDALVVGASLSDSVDRALLLDELTAAGVTCFCTTRTCDGQRSPAAKQAAARASAQFELVRTGTERALWVREAPWSRQEGQSFAVAQSLGAVPSRARTEPAEAASPTVQAASPAVQAASPAARLARTAAQLVSPVAQLAAAVRHPLGRLAFPGASSASPAVVPLTHAAGSAGSAVSPRASAPSRRVVEERAWPQAAPPAGAVPLSLQPPLPAPRVERVERLPVAVAASDGVPRRLLLVLFSSAASAFLVWRASLLSEVDYPAYSTAFLAAEVLALLAALWCYLLMAAPRRPAAPPRPDPSMTVDVLILTYNEELDLVRHTMLAARDMDEPHAVWVCDDGRRPALAAMCKEMGVGYITRDNNAHYKAGNVNNALAATNGDLVLILDADHVPRQMLLTRIMGYFRDEKLAHVQIPQIYYNVDSFQHSLALRRAATWHESSVFHHGIMHGLAGANSTCFLGTGALMRRSALASIGGVATGNITEDVLTGMRLHAHGWQSVFVDEPLATLLAPDTALAYAQQRLRWAQGNVEILRTENPLRKQGLSRWQRLAYSNTFGFYLLSYLHLFVYLVPGLYLFTGIAPLSVNDPYNVSLVAAFTCVAILNYLAMSYPHARLFHTECFKLLNLPINLRASMALLNPGGRAFTVTPKGFHVGLPLWVIIPIAAICLFNLVGLGYGVALMSRGDGHFDALLLASAWATFYGVASALTLVYTFSRRAAREPYTVPVSVAARLRTGEGELVGEGRVRRFCHELAYVEVGAGEVAVGSTLTLELASPALTLKGRVTAHGGATDSTRIARLELLPMARPDWDVLSSYLFEVANPAFLEGLRGGCTSQLPLAEGAQARPLAHGVDFLPLRSEIV